MTTCYLDSNVVVGLIDGDSVHHSRAQKAIEDLAQKDVGLVVSPLVLDEFLYVMKYLLGEKYREPSVMRRRLSRVYTQFISLSMLKVVDVPTDKEAQLLVLEFMRLFSLRPRDAYHLLTLTMHQVEYFATFDTDFEAVFESGFVKSAVF